MQQVYSNTEVGRIVDVDQLNRRPRKTLGWEISAERLHELLAA
ncbi:hypothetical protein [Streptomyces sp. NPDC049887]